MNHRKRFGRLSVRLGASAALLSGLLVMDLQAGGAATLSVTNVTAGISAPNFAPGAFTATGTIKNTGTALQVGNSTVTFSVTRGTVTTAVGCTLANGGAVCSVADLPAGAKADFPVTVTPNVGSLSVITKVTTRGALPDASLPPDQGNDDEVEATTYKEISNVTAGVTVPENSAGPFTARGTITNAGNVTQVAGSSVTFSVIRGAVTSVPTGCVVSGSGAVCTAGALAVGAGESFDVTVTPSTVIGSVTTTVTTKANQPDVNAPDSTTDDDDVATGSTRNYQHNLAVGETACDPDAIDTASCFTNTSNKPIFVTLSEVDVNWTCGGSPCFGTAPHAYYPAEGGDPNAPLTWRITPAEKFACAGKGNECLKHVLFYVLDGQTEDPIKVPLCESFSNNKPKPAIADPSGAPCLNFLSRTNDGRTTFHLSLVGDIGIPRIIS